MESHGDSVLESGRATAMQPSDAAALLFSRQEAHAIPRPASLRECNRTTMASSSSIAKKARSKAEADFATWLMMAKLGGFADLPSNPTCAVPETASTSARCTQFDLAPKIAPRLADFREHGGSDCHI
jgi:hypothetical protein